MFLAIALVNVDALCDVCDAVTSRALTRKTPDAVFTFCFLKTSYEGIKLKRDFACSHKFINGKGVRADAR